MKSFVIGVVTGVMAVAMVGGLVATGVSRGQGSGERGESSAEWAAKWKYKHWYVELHELEAGKNGPVEQMCKVMNAEGGTAWELVLVTETRQGPCLVFKAPAGAVGE